jgi:hypothetical protein
MWFCINEVMYSFANRTIIVIKSVRRFKPPKWATSLIKTKSASEVVKLSELGVVLKGEGRDYIKQYFGKWMREREFLKIMECALYRSYKSVKTVERMMKALREFVNKPIEPKPPRPRRPLNAIYELPPNYPSKAVAQRARRRIRLPLTAYIYVFSKTIHVVPYYVENRATVVIPLNPEEIADANITEEGLNTLRDLLEAFHQLERRDPEVARAVKLVVALAKLLSLLP